MLQLKQTEIELKAIDLRLKPIEIELSRLPELTLDDISFYPQVQWTDRREKCQSYR